MRILSQMVVLSLIFQLPSAFAEGERERPYSVGEYSIGGPEFWFRGSTKKRSPQFGWTPDDASPAARRCAAEAWDRLTAILERAKPDKLKLAANRVDGFFVWIDDLSEASSNTSRTNIWQWNADSEGRGGLMKFVSYVDKEGVCHVPEERDLYEFARKKLKSFGMTDAQLPTAPADTDTAFAPKTPATTQPTTQPTGH